MARGQSKPPPVTAPLDALPPFEGVPVIYSTLALRKAGDGLSDALKVDPVALHHGDEVWMIVKGRVVDVQHPPIKRDDPTKLVRKHVVDAEQMAILDADVLEPLLTEAIDAVQKKIDASRGVQSFDYDENADDPLAPKTIRRPDGMSDDDWETMKALAPEGSTIIETEDDPDA